MRIENTTEHQIDIHASHDQAFSVPPKGERAAGVFVNGACDIPDDVFAAIKHDRVITAWFDSGDLVVGKDKSATVSAATKSAADRAVAEKAEAEETERQRKALADKEKAGANKGGK